MVQILSFGQSYLVAGTRQEALDAVAAAESPEAFVEFVAMDEAVYPYEPHPTMKVELRASAVHGVRDFSQV